MSAPFDTTQVIAWTGARWIQGGEDVHFSGASIDTRSLEAGSLFIAIRGVRHDAHEFLDAALAAGATGLLVEHGRSLPAGLRGDLCVLAVEDTTRALGDLASGHRSGHAGPLVAITGSSGKTTTKEMCAAVLAAAGTCLKTEGNLNNEFGLPLTLLRREEGHQRVVVELGMNHRGEIARLAAIARPNVGVVTNVGTAHIEFLGSRENIAAEKGDLLAALPADGVAVLNADDPQVLDQSSRSAARVVFFGHAPEAHVRAEHPRVAGSGFAFLLCAPQGRIEVEVAGLGETTCSNALAAAAAALAAGVELPAIAEGLAAYRPVPGRLQPIELSGGGLLIDDSYNANPQSMEVALRILARLAAGQPGGDTRRLGVAILGDMGELGEASAEAHRETGRLAATLGIDRIFAVGEQAETIAAGATERGMDPAHVFAADSWEKTTERLDRELHGGERVLVKGSRAMRMERIVEHLTHSDGGHG